MRNILRNPLLIMLAVAGSALVASCDDAEPRLADPAEITTPERPPVYFRPRIPLVRYATEVPAVAVRVWDEESGGRIEHLVTGWIEDGEFRETLEYRIPPDAEEGELVLAGGFERAGSYTVHVDGVNFDPWTGAADVPLAKEGWPETVTLDATLRFRSLSGTWERTPESASRRPDAFYIQHTPEIAEVEFDDGSHPDVVRLDGERVVLRMYGPNGGGYVEWNLIHVPPDTLSGTYGRDHYVAVRTGPAPSL